MVLSFLGNLVLGFVLLNIGVYVLFITWQTLVRGREALQPPRTLANRDRDSTFHGRPRGRLTTMYCEKCGFDRVDDNETCTFCGNPRSRGKS